MGQADRPALPAPAQREDSFLSLLDTQANLDQQVKLIRWIQAALNESLRRGWHGQLVIEIPIQDGTLQDPTRLQAIRELLPPA